MVNDNNNVNSRPRVIPTPLLESDKGKHLRKGIALCLSGGGYRAMLFHLGSIIRINELGLLGQLKRVSSVSGGSIVAALLGLKWSQLTWTEGEHKVATNLDELVVKPIQELAGHTLDADLRTVMSALGGWGLGTFGEAWHFAEGVMQRLTGVNYRDKLAGITKHFTAINAGSKLSDIYDRHLFQGKTLQDLPESPFFYINATNVQTGNLWIFSKRKMGDTKIGFVASPTVKLADAVAASSAFPPFLSPFVLPLTGKENWLEVIPTNDPESEFLAETLPVNVDPTSIDHFDEDHEALKTIPSTQQIYLSDGGVYDNIGIDTAWKRYKLLLVSDGGARLNIQHYPASDILFHSVRVASVVDSQVRMLRKWQLLMSYELDSGPYSRKGAYWSIRGTIKKAHPELNPPELACDDNDIRRLSREPTRLKAMPKDKTDKLVNWGYAKADYILRSYAKELINQKNVSVPRFPHPGGVKLT